MNSIFKKQKQLNKNNPQLDELPIQHIITVVIRTRSGRKANRKNKLHYANNN